MGRELDVYCDWLDLPEGARPPDHYTLLGIARGESRTEVIDAAADARLKMVRPRCLKYPKEGTQLLNEITRARLCLCDPDERLAYDRELESGHADDQAQWAQIHSRWTNPLLESQTATGPALPTLSDKAPPESETYALAETASEPAGETRSEEFTQQGRWCPHCGSRLLSRATFCARCTVSDMWLTDWSEFKCRGCNQRLPAGTVVCRKCKCDLSLHGARPRLPPGPQRVIPYFAAELSSKGDGLHAHATVDEKEAPPDRRDRNRTRAARESTRRRATSSTHDRRAPGSSDDDDSEHPWVVYYRENRMFVSALAIILGCGILSSPLWLIDWNRKRPAKSPRTVVSGGSPAVAANVPQQPIEPAPQAVVPSDAPDGSGADKTSSPVPAQTPDPDQLFESALADLNDPEKTPAILLNRRREVMAASLQGPNALRFGDLADKLLQAARERHLAQLERALAAADDDDEYLAIVRDLEGDVALETMDSNGRRMFSRQLFDRWYEACGKQLAARVSRHFEQQNFAAAWAERETPLPDKMPESFRYDQQFSWRNYCERTVENCTASFAQTLQASVDEKFQSHEFEEAMELATEFEEALNLQFQEMPPRQFAYAAQQVDIHVEQKLTWKDMIAPLIAESEDERAQALVEAMLRQTHWKSRGEELREQLKKTGKWARTSSPKPKDVKRKPFKDPEADYLTLRDTFRSQSYADPQGFDYWYKKLYANSNNHYAGFFVLVQDGQIFVVEGLAHAAYFAARRKPSDKFLKTYKPSGKAVKSKKPSKPPPVVPYWYGTREEAVEAFPNARFVTDATDGSLGSPSGVGRGR